MQGVWVLSLVGELGSHMSSSMAKTNKQTNKQTNKNTTNKQTNFCVCVYHIFFSHLSIEWHLSCFHLLAIVNNSTMKVSVYISPFFCNSMEYMMSKYSIVMGVVWFFNLIIGHLVCL